MRRTDRTRRRAADTLRPHVVPWLAAATTTVAALELLGAAAPARAAGQEVLDQGTYHIRIGGREVATETFAIRRSGTGAGSVIIATGRVVSDGSQVAELTSRLQVSGSTLRPAAYDVTVQAAERETIAGRVSGGRFSARIVSQAGENMREYLVSDGAILVEEGVVHHNYFLARRVESGSARIPIVVPRENRQLWANVTMTGTEPVRIAGQTVQARRITVRPEAGPERVIWADEAGRVLRLEIAAEQYVAERTSLPG